MLIIGKNGEVMMMKAAKAGANIAEVKKVGDIPVTLSNNKVEKRPIWGSVYLDGLPLGDSCPEIKAPIALETGDRLWVADLFPERVLYEIHRDGKLVWAEKELHAEEELKASDKAAHLAAVRAFKQ